MPVDYEGLREFLKRGEGASPPVFVGRREIIEAIMVASTKPSDEAKMTQIVQGAPGAGKSSLLKELLRQAREAGNAHVPILLTGEINEPVDILGPIARMLSEKHAPKFLAEHSHTRGFGLGVDTDSVGARIGRSRTRTEAVPAATWDSLRLWATASGCLPDRPIILTIDEAQRFRLEPDAPVAKTLQGVHDGTTGLPVVLVLAGLSDTAERARRMDLTRGHAIHEVRPLTRDETMDLMSGFCGKFRIDSSRHLPQLEALSSPCEGWPRHLHFTLRALTRETLRNHGDMNRFDWAQLERQILDRHRKYYWDQNSLDMRRADILTSRVMAGLKNGMHYRQMQELVENSVVDRPGQRLPKGKDAESFLDHLIHQGALYIRMDNSVYSPIPSFRSFLIDQGTEPDMNPSVSEPDMD